MSYVVQELVWEIGTLKQALAEKDREIEALKAEFKIDLPAKEKAFIDDLQRRLRLGYQFTKTDCRIVLNWMMTMLERDKIVEICEALRSTAQTVRAQLFLDHDQAQRAVIEQQAKEIESHKKGCFRSHPHDEMNEVCELKTEIARLKNELSHWSWVRFKQLEEENKTLREALQAICSGISGDLLGTTSMDRETMQSIAQQALAEASP